MTTGPQGSPTGAAPTHPAPQTHLLPPITSICTESGVQCAYDTNGEQRAAPLGPGVSGSPRVPQAPDVLTALLPTACVCTYDGQHFRPGDVIYHTTDGTGGCISARCGANGTIERTVYGCSTTSPVPHTTFSFSTLPTGEADTLGGRPQARCRGPGTGQGLSKGAQPAWVSCPHSPRL